MLSPVLPGSLRRCKFPVLGCCPLVRLSFHVHPFSTHTAASKDQPKSSGENEAWGGDIKAWEGIRVEQNVRYAHEHPRNVLDMYEPSSLSVVSTVRPPSLLFVHGGMWVRGSKEQNTLSTYDVLSSLMPDTYSGMLKTMGENENKVTIEDKEPTFSNVGLTIAGNGGVACVTNYRLAAHSSSKDVAHPHQVMDVARSIVFMMERELSQTIPSSGPSIYVGGHSAGAHLLSLALADPRYLHAVMDERGIARSMVSKMIAGFIGISGVYNLRRLAMSPMAEITLGPAFFGDEDGHDTSLEASPVHALLRAHGTQPPLANMPVLLLNAESDMHLHQDSAEFLVALGQHSDVSRGDRKQQDPIVVGGRNHLSIMRDFGRGLYLTDDICVKGQNEYRGATKDPLGAQRNGKEPPTQSDESGMLSTWNTTSMLNQSMGLLSSASSSLSSYFSEDDPDETALRVLEFMKLKPNDK